MTDDEAERGWERFRAVEARLGVKLALRGSLEPLSRLTFAVVSSRKPRVVSRGESWVTRTLAAVQDPRFGRHALVSSLGTVHYEIAAWSRARSGGSLVLGTGQAPPAAGSASQWNWDYEALLGPQTTEVHPAAHQDLRSSNGRKQAPYRDRLVDLLADEIIAIDVREGGNWQRLLRARLDRGGTVYFDCGMQDVDRASEWLLEAGAKAICIDRAGPTPARSESRPATAQSSFANVAQFNLEGFLFHYTRRRTGPWPGQPRSEYLEELVTGAPGSAHNGLDALLRILRQRRVHASPRLIRGGSAVCCFTDRSPSEICELARWSAGQLRWSFEPYAVGFRRDYALRKGLQPALHLAPDAFEGLTPEERFRFQRLEAGRLDWTAEGEWRLRGDLDFRDAANGDVSVLVPDAESAAQVASLTEFEIAILGTDWISKTR